MKSAGKWFVLSAGLAAVWYVTRAVVVQSLGIFACFVAAFQASVHQIARSAEVPARPAPAAPKPLPKRLAAERAYRAAHENDLIIDLREEISAS